MPQMVAGDWLLLALETGEFPEASGSSSPRGIGWQRGRRSVEAHALDDHTLLATFLERAGRSGSPSNVIRRYRSSRAELDLFLEDVRSFFGVAVATAHE